MLLYILLQTTNIYQIKLITSHLNSWQLQYNASTQGTLKFPPNPMFHKQWSKNQQQLLFLKINIQIREIQKYHMCRSSTSARTTVQYLLQIIIFGSKLRLNITLNNFYLLQQISLQYSLRNFQLLSTDKKMHAIKPAASSLLQETDDTTVNTGDSISNCQIFSAISTNKSIYFLSNALNFFNFPLTVVFNCQDLG
eukprot:TRINITY_DN1110_c0_g1_i2.p1 TRINITY_DN1110_c0_g1~~TRINITY_DN1110_c0_g1_i2.p1  ORF type:complete len:195 (+),score=-5.81 TRINITY_DN1110_c0_g1_i2:60-644(+)